MPKAPSKSREGCCDYLSENMGSKAVKNEGKRVGTVCKEAGKNAGMCCTKAVSCSE